MEGASITSMPNSSNSTLPLPYKQDESQSENVKEEEDDEENGEEEKDECGFCLFMKAGPCGEKFAAWEQCVRDSKKNKDYAALKCVDVFKTLNECMTKNQDYYDFFLVAEKAELEKEEESMSENSEDKASSTKKAELEKEDPMSRAQSTDLIQLGIRPTSKKVSQTGAS